MRQADAHREAGERSRTGYTRRHFYFLLGLRIPREAVRSRRLSWRDFSALFSPSTETCAANHVSTITLRDWSMRMRKSIAPVRNDRETLRNIATTAHSLPDNSTRIAR